MQKHALQKLLKNRAVKAGVFIMVGFAAVIIIALITADIYVQHNKKEIITRVKEAFAKDVNGILQIGDMHISVWEDFPNIAVDMTDASIRDSVHHLPLLQAKKISCAVSLFKLAAAPPDIERVKISGGIFHLFVDSAGFDNSYLLSPKKRDSSATTHPPSPQSAVIHRIEVEDFEFISEDAANHKKFDIVIHSVLARVERKDSLLTISASTDCLIKSLGF